MRSIHGLSIFYINFIRGLSSIFPPLTETMRGDKKDFKCTIEEARSFYVLKAKVMEQPILGILYFSKAF